MTVLRRAMTGLALQMQEVLGLDPLPGNPCALHGRRGSLRDILSHNGLGTSL